MGARDVDGKWKIGNRKDLEESFHLSFCISTVPTLVEQNQLFAKLV